ELGGVQAPDVLVEAREVQDDEEVVVVLVDLRALVAREDVLVVERVEVEALLEPSAMAVSRLLDVDPADVERLDGLDLRSLRLDDGGRRDGATARHAREAWLGQARHGDFAARRSW